MFWGSVVESYAVIGRTDNRVYLASIDDAPFDVLIMSEVDFDEDARIVVVE